MWAARASSVGGFAGLVVMVATLSTVLLGAPGASVGLGNPTNELTHSGSAPTTLPSTTFVSAPPSGATGPDDITELALPGFDHGRTVIWTAYQNGIDPNGSPGTSGGPTMSTVVGYDRASGAIVRSVSIIGKVDGLTADPAMGTILATDNEDANSGINLIYPALGAVAHYQYSPSPTVSGNGGTDSIAIVGASIYVSHSNPNDTTQATDYLVTLHRSTLVAHLTPAFYDDGRAWDVNAGLHVTLALTDPDTNYLMPPQSPRFAGQLATVSQADGKLVFASHLGGSARLSLLNLSDNVTGNLPPIDGLAVASCATGTLYVVDGGANSISALTTQGWPSGTVFVGEPNDNGNPLIGTLNLATGHIRPLGNHFVSPKGMLFLPGHCGDSGRGDHHGHDGDRGSDAGFGGRFAEARSFE
jgi:hypothetical protein